jgi:hypothetical protein
MKCAIAVLVAVAGLSAAAHGQVMKILVSRDGVNFSNSITVLPSIGATIEVLVTMSYTGLPDAVAGFGSANFQPTISNWHSTDTLLPLQQGGNTNPADGSGVIQPQFYVGSTHGDGTPVSAGYVPGTYGRVNPMGRTVLIGSNALVGFVHNNPDGSGLTYLRIAQASNTNWIGGAGNTSGGSGVNCSQLYVVGRSTSDPDFWGNREVTTGGTPERDPTLDYRLQNVELFRFAFTLGSSVGREMTIDAPLAGQQRSSTGVRYAGYFSDPSQILPGTQLGVTVQTAVVHIVPPSPGTAIGLGLGGLAVGRRRRMSSGVMSRGRWSETRQGGD